LKPTADAHRTVLVAGTYEEKGKGVLGSWTATKGVVKGKLRRPVASPPPPPPPAAVALSNLCTGV